MKLKTEHIDSRDHLNVPVARAWVDPTPKREGWKPFFVSINLDGWDSWEGRPQKIVHYKRVSA